MVIQDNPLGTALRRWRDRVSPLDVGLPVAGRRRAAGLRREELATLAGLSVDYLVRLEQGRAVRPSEQVAGALARALQLETSERDHLFRLAHLPLPGPERIATHIPPSVQRLIIALADQALAVFAADWTLISWTPLWGALIGNPEREPARRYNLVRDTFIHDESFGCVPFTTARGDAAKEAALVADLRATQGAFPNDPRLHALIEECRARSDRFAALWSQDATAGAMGHDRKTFAHPLAGDITLDSDILTVPGSDLRIIAFTTAAGTRAAAQLDFLRVGAVHTSFAP
ncbi:helix-turn-helix transcriptional regulator [Actinoalloteichus hymeniacidonis]|uniref:DNA binding protein with helix-turn-helix domain n=1 Tax=Actinoalloteichus hymeniacidonis TaxID=340345 RepID=A0AAC9MXC5_9PSEU|nr:helix-turn-helix transcriptional regulator [Actinoalloteichus hymeniacidonis]AOS61906.1 DNA binding protein with helix-turn-helix domain [Actinoalloteichus hymeniacidonis]MBB5910074.1 transcriptional regulator with XRE-family HTH domain [Actinoalloteichus hymeniacidonis]